MTQGKVISENITVSGDVIKHTIYVEAPMDAVMTKTINDYRDLMNFKWRSGFVAGFSGGIVFACVVIAIIWGTR